ncbi:MAG TPA: hypothetical protein VFP61_08220 [Acidimicrobiales bacterium]|nr:hypothetical protein [Acidimicrobiales bacterium]
MLRPTAPFTKVMRGYDPDEVETHLRALDDEAAETSAALEAAEAAAAALREQVVGLQRRLDELESAVRTDTPRTMTALGERLLLVLGETEDAAAEKLRTAEQQAAGIVATASERAAALEVSAAAGLADAEARAAALVTDAEARATALVADAEGRAAALVTDAEGRAAAGLADAEARATALVTDAEARAASLEADTEAWAEQRRDEVEAWEHDVRTGIEQERARAATDFARIKLAWQAELDDLQHRRTAVLDQLDTVATAVRAAVSAGRATAGLTPGDDGALAAPMAELPAARLGGPVAPDDLREPAGVVDGEADGDAEPAAGGATDGAPAEHPTGG